MIISSLRTIYGLNLQTKQINNIPYTLLPNTTLNEKFHLLDNVSLPTNVYPYINYFVIGIGGINVTDGINGYNISRHSPVDAGLFQEIPFIIRPVNDDLLPNIQEQYRFKVKEIINNVEYYCYYLKRIDNTVTREGLYNVSVTQDIPTLTYFNTNSGDILNPIPRDSALGALDTTNSKYVTNVVKLRFTLFKDELLELENVFNIKYPNEDKRLTEIGVCSGLDTTSLVDEVTTITEATGVQIMYHYQVEIYPSILLASDKELVRSLEIGGMEPLVL